MTNRLTPEALDALLAEHVGEIAFPHNCRGCSFGTSHPCAIYLLASEVRDARPVRDAAIEYVAAHEPPSDLWNPEIYGPAYKRLSAAEEELWAAVAHYEEGTK